MDCLGGTEVRRHNPQLLRVQAIPLDFAGPSASWPAYNQLIAWSNIYDTANTETSKMIVAQPMERVDVFRGYELKIKFAITVEQFLIGLDISA